MSAMRQFDLDLSQPGGDEPAVLNVYGERPEIGGASLELEGSAVRWSLPGGDALPEAGTGVAASIVDVLLGASNAIAVGREEAIPVDQTHTSVIVDRRWVVKLVGAWGAADRAARILTRLRRAGVDAIPAFGGSVRWTHPLYGSSTVALVSEFIPDAHDGWTWAVDDVVAHVRDGAPEPDWPARLGELVARVHDALREPADAPNARDGDRDRALHAFERTSSFLERRESRAEEASPGLVLRFRNRAPAIRARLETIPDSSSTPLVTPHGDLHVGQVLRTPEERYVLLDFDGDPQWTKEQGNLADGAARDIAHMLVSIDLVAAVVQRRLGSPDERAWAWGEAAQRTFLDSYEIQAGPDMLDHRVLDGLKAEQLLLELSYAELFRPEWSYAPDGVVTRRFPPVSTESEMEPPWNPPASPKT